MQSSLLPTGLSLDSSAGIISGIPTGFGSGNVVIQAMDSKSSAMTNLNFQLFNQLTINPVTPPNPHLNAPYSFQLVAQGTVPASWAISAGQLPPGLQLAESSSDAFFGIISGTPTQVGTFQATVQVQDSTLPQTASLPITIAVDSHLAITKMNLRNGGQNQSYSDSFAEVNGTTPFQWSVTGNFPPGLNLDPASGNVTGTPSLSGSFNYTVTVQDSSSPQQTDSQQGTLNLLQQVAIQGSFPTAYLNKFYEQTFFAFGGQPPYIWSIPSGNLPPGITLRTQFPDVAGTATQLGAFSFVIQVQDSGPVPYVVTLPVTLNVAPPPLFVGGPPLSPAGLGLTYHSQIAMVGGTPPYTVVVSSGQLPPGLILDPSTGFIDGTPTQLGAFTFASQVTDSGSPPQVVSPSEEIDIRNPLGRNDTIATATPLGNGSWQASISPYVDPITSTTANPDTDYYRLIANPGTTVHVETFAQRSFSATLLDTVLEIVDANGQQLPNCTSPAFNSPCLNDDIDSTTTDSALDLKVPGTAGTQTIFYVHVLDWRGDARPDLIYHLNLNGSGVIDPLIISPTTLGNGATRGVSYQQQFSSTGGIGTVAWSLDSGAFPPGWSINAAGLLSGVATTNGTYTFTIKATDSGNPSQTTRVKFTLLIADPLVITSPANWPDACSGKPYSFTITTSGGVPPIRFGFSSPAWTSINLDTSTGIFSGTPGGLGTLNGVVGATDSAQPSSGQTQAITLNIVTCP